MRWEISKEFEISYGHRVWSQKLNTDFSLDSMCSCKFLHGHNSKIVIYLSSNELNAQGMVFDFKNLNFVKNWLDKALDHKFIIDINDPLFEYDIKQPIERLFPGKFGRLDLIKQEGEYFIIDEKCYGDLTDALREKYESFVIVDFVPTSENLSKWIFEVVQNKLSKTGVNVVKVEFYETPKSRSTFIK